MPKTSEKLDITKQKLIDSTISILNEQNHNYKSLTSREIASRAGVPLGMINYCFGSKDNLVLKVFLDTFDNKWNGDSLLQLLKIDSLADDPKTKLKQLSFKVMQFYIKHSDCIKDILTYIITTYDLSKVHRSYPLLRVCLGPDVSDDKCKYLAFELGGIMQLAILRKDDLKTYYNINLEDDEQLKQFIDEHIDRLVN